MGLAHRRTPSPKVAAAISSLSRMTSAVRVNDDADGAPCFDKVTALDSHGNGSAAASFLPLGTEAVGDAPLHAAFAAPAPNPDYS